MPLPMSNLPQVFLFSETRICLIITLVLLCTLKEYSSAATLRGTVIPRVRMVRQRVNRNCSLVVFFITDEIVTGLFNGCKPASFCVPLDHRALGKTRGSASSGS